MRFRLPLRLLRAPAPEGRGRALRRVLIVRALHPVREGRGLRVWAGRDRLPIAGRARLLAPADPVLVREVRVLHRVRVAPVREDRLRAPALQGRIPALLAMKAEDREASENFFMFKSGEKP